MRPLDRLAAGLAIATCSVALASRAAAPSTPTPAAIPEDRVAVERLGSAVAARAALAGSLVALAAPRRAGGSRDLLLLVAPPDPSKPPDGEAAAAPSPCDPPRAAADRPAPAHRRLVRFDPFGAGSLTTLRDDLPADARDLVPADLDGDGVDELLLSRPDRVDTIRDDGSRRFAGGSTTIAQLPEGETAALQPGAIGAGTGRPAVVSIASLGSLRSWGVGADGAWAPRADIPLPLNAERESHRLELTTPLVRTLDAGGGVDLIVVEPEARGAERLRTIVIRADAPEAERRQEAWSKLPAAEKLMERSFLLLDGRPALAVTTVPAGKLSFFGEKLLRVFFLENDRTRAGKPPVAAVETHANLWQDTRTFAVDVDGDSRQDLVVGYWKGLKDDTVVLDAYLRRGDGTFERSPRTTSFDVEEADRGVLLYGVDLDGKGLPDLVLVANGRVELYPGGDATTGGRKLVSAKPLWSVPLPTGAGTDRAIVLAIGAEGVDTFEQRGSGRMPSAVDLDGDGRRELLVTGGDASSGQVLAVLPAR